MRPNADAPTMRPNVNAPAAKDNGSGSRSVLCPVTPRLPACRRQTTGRGHRRLATAGWREMVGRAGAAEDARAHALTHTRARAHTYTQERLNRTLHTLTGVSVLAIPAQLWTGYFGMNFEVFPLLRSDFGLPVFWALVAASTAACAVWFRRAMRPDADAPAPPAARPRRPGLLDSDEASGGEARQRLPRRDPDCE